MIRLNYSSSGIDTNALWVNYPVSASEALYSITSSYDQSTWELSGSIISNTTKGGDGWLLVQSNRNQAPTASGQYMADISPYVSEFQDAIWNVTALKWADNNDPIAIIDYRWATFQKYLNRKYDGGFIDIERVWVSGSNDPAITDFISTNENGTFNTCQD